MVTVGIDPHKHVHVAVAIDAGGRPIGKPLTLKNSALQVTALLTWIRTIAGGSARHLGHRRRPGIRPAPRRRHQRPAAPVLPQGQRPAGAWPRPAGRRGCRTQRPAAQDPRPEHPGFPAGYRAGAAHCQLAAPAAARRRRWEDGRMADMRRRTPEPPPRPPKIEIKPGMAQELLRELAPLLAEEGIDAGNIDVPDLQTLQAAMNRAVAAQHDPLHARRPRPRPGRHHAAPARRGAHRVDRVAPRLCRRFRTCDRPILGVPAGLTSGRRFGSHIHRLRSPGYRQARSARCGR